MTVAQWQAGPRTLCLRLVFFICIGGCTALRAQPALKPDTSQTLSIGVVIDTHPQQESVIEFERQVVDALRSALAGAEGKEFVISYSDHIELVGDWSPVASGLKDAVARIALDSRVSKARGAVLNDGLMEGLIKLDSSAEGHRKGLIVIGEGNDGGSTAKFSQVLRAAKDKHIQCFALLVANHRSQVGRVRQFGFDLYRLASATGGKSYDVRTKPKLLDEALKDVLRRLVTPVQSAVAVPTEKSIRAPEVRRSEMQGSTEQQRHAAHRGAGLVRIIDGAVIGVAKAEAGAN